MDIPISIVAKIGESLVVPVGRQFGYLIHCNRNIENLRHQLQKLVSLRNDVQRSIEAESRNGYVIGDVVKHWTERADRFKLEAIKFLEEDVNVNKRCFNGWFPDLVTLYRLGKEAKKKTMGITELQEDSKFGNISNPAPPSGIKSMRSGDFVNYDTTKLATMKVMEAFKDDNIILIGIHGMGGVGKTTLVKEIGIKAKEDKLFDEVVMAVVSQNVEFKKIQDQIADMLGLKFTEQSDNGRATRLCDRMKAVNKILVILDDVWNKLDVAAVGIPFGNDHKGCKLVITTRREQVCRVMGMGSQLTKIVHLECLSEQESWDLFRRNVGNAVDSPTLNPVAKEIARECRDLPVALVTVGKAMRDKEPEEWKEAAEELRKSVPTNIEGVDQDVFKCIKFSYDYLRDNEAKSCFLLCSLFPEDSDILIETLVRYGVGLEIFKNVDNVQDARRRANSVIKNLKDSCLLLVSEEEGCIKMHDVVRDVAISVGSDKYLVRAGENLKEWPNGVTLDHYTGMSLMSNQIGKVPDVWERPNLEIVLLQENRGISWTSSFFEGMKALRVLDLSYNGDIRSSSSSFCYLTCLRTLILEGLRIGNTSVLGQIKTLEVLSFRRSVFHESPVAIRELTNLRLLDMSSCQHDRRSIPGIFVPNMISCLSSRLEELYLSSSIRTHGRVWGFRPTRIEWKFVAELKSLRRLTVLTICIDDVKDAPEDFVFPDLDSFSIKRSFLSGRQYTYSDSVRPNYLEIGGSSRSMIWWRKCVKVLLKRTNYLSLHFVDMKNIVDLLFDGEGLNALKILSFLGCHQLEYLIDYEFDTAAVTQQNENHRQVLAKLEELSLVRLHNFKGIFSDGALLLLLPNSTVSQLLLPKLRSLKIVRCPVRFNLTRGLHQLEELYISQCHDLEQVFDFQDHGSSDKGHIWSGPCSHLVHLHNLRVVSIHECKRLMKNIFQPSMARTLQQLEELSVGRCEKLEEIVAKENEGPEEESKKVDKIVLTSLKILELRYLSNLNAFCSGSFPFEWPSLEQVIVYKCPKMKTFAAATTSGIQSTPKLKAITLDNEKIMLQGVDLNTVIQNPIKANEAHTSISEDESTSEDESE